MSGIATYHHRTRVKDLGPDLLFYRTGQGFGLGSFILQNASRIWTQIYYSTDGVKDLNPDLLFYRISQKDLCPDQLF